MKLSIIIPFYRNFKNLSNCLASLTKQTVFDLWGREVEVIVVDDGSGGNENVFQSSIINIQYFKTVHSGAPAARNFGFQKSSGEYVFFCDADVVFLKTDALEKMIKILEENPNKAFCYSSFKFGWKKFPGVKFDAEKLKQNNYISTMSLVRRAWLEKISTDKPWDESLKKFQDWDLWLSIVENGGEGILISDYLWQAHSHGTMSAWLPSIFYKIFRSSNKVKKYEEEKTIVMKKHKLL
ncbi:MAG: glycosyltransferase family A protein [Patescibacteria group bacterium]|nr:glycosyltransferase family A protein [Patescibacteria group bacterium]